MGWWRLAPSRRAGGRRCYTAKHATDKSIAAERNGPRRNQEGPATLGRSHQKIEGGKPKPPTKKTVPTAMSRLLALSFDANQTAANAD